MIKLLARIGRLNTVLVITCAASAASIVLTSLVVLLLNANGQNLNLVVAATIAAAIPLIVAPLLSWHLVGLLLRIHRVEEEMRSLASFDSLTGLLSRHAFFDRANTYVSLARRDRTLFSVLVIDLDHFKLINDRYGHPAGDAVLKLFADVVNSVARRSDIIGRLGGEEFALVLPSTSADEALEFCHRLHAAVRKAVLKYGDDLIEYRISIGLASSDVAPGDIIDGLLARADVALYRAKRAGRNRTAVFDADSERVAAAR